MSKVYQNRIGLTNLSDEWRLAYKQTTKRNRQRYEASKRAKKYGVLDTLTLKQWLSILVFSEGCCFYCGEDVGAENLGIDHYIPFCAGGGNTLENAVPSCFPCNTKKGSSIPEITQIHLHQIIG